LLALQKMGASDCQIRMVSGLTPEQKREFVIKDNSNFGRYDFDSLANEWSDLPLADWGVDLPDDWIKNNEKTNQNINEIYELKYNVIVECDNEAQQKELLTKFEKEGLICRALIL